LISVMLRVCMIRFLISVLNSAEATSLIELLN
jgi:hypothetical protein